MKHWDKITCVSVQLSYPDNIVDKNDDIWRMWAARVTQAMDSVHGNEELANIDDQTCGFDIETVSFDVTDFKSQEHLDMTIEWCHQQLLEVISNVQVCSNEGSS